MTYGSAIKTSVNSIGYSQQLKRKVLAGRYTGTVQSVIEALIEDGGADVFLNGVAFRTNDVDDAGDLVQLKTLSIDIDPTGKYADDAIDLALSGLAGWYIDPTNRTLIIYNRDQFSTIGTINIDSIIDGECQDFKVIKPSVDIERSFLTRVVVARDAESFALASQDINLEANHIFTLLPDSEEQHYTMLDKYDQLLEFYIFYDAVACLMETIAGNGNPALTGDGGLATAAEVDSPFRVVTDSQSNIYILMPSYGTIRKVNNNTGIINNFIGSNSEFFDFEPTYGTPATGQGIAIVYGLGVDSDNNIYYTEANFQYVGKVDPAGIVTKFFDLDAFYTSLGIGGGFPFAIACHEDIVYVLDNDHEIVVKIQSGVGSVFVGPAILSPTVESDLFSPYGLAVDSVGNLYIADGQNCVIKKVTVATNTIEDWAGTGVFNPLPVLTGDKLSVDISQECQIAFDSNDNAYIVDADYAYVRKIDAATGQVTISAGTGTPAFAGDGGPPLEAQIADVGAFGAGIWVDRNDNEIYLADEGNHRVRKYC